MAHSNTFEFNSIFLVSAVLISCICILYVLLDFSINQKSREIPTRLMVARAIFNFVAVLVVLIVINLQPASLQQHNSATCQAQGAIFLFSLYMATAYYALICWELVVTLKDPFRAPSSGSPLFHVSVVLICFIVVFSIAISKQFEFRPEFEICFMKEGNVGLNALNWLVIYIPLFIICIGGFIATLWIYKRLRTGINRDTYEVRLVALKQQTYITALFTFNYIFQGICWMLLFTKSSKNIDHTGPYLLSSFCLIACIFDAITWIVRKYIKAIPIISSSISNFIMPQNQIYNAQNNGKIKTISAALRKEVITCIIDGISKSDRKSSELLQINNPNSNSRYNQTISISGTGNNYREILIPQKGDNENLLGLSKYYPMKLDDKCKTYVIEEYPIDPIHTNTIQAIFCNYAPKIFSYLRSVYGVTDESYYNSILPINDVSKLSLELCANFSEGRSGAFIFFTKDKRFLIKTLVKTEAQLLLDTLKRYTAYMTNNKQKTYLLQYYGLHSIRLYGHSIYFVVNNNIFSDIAQKPDERYDLKGSWCDRNTNHRIEDKKLMKDKDLKKPLMVNRLLAASVYQQLKKDSEFLGGLGIMDYSLLLGIFYTKVPLPKDNKGIDEDVDEMKYDENEEDVNGNNNNLVLNAEMVEGAGKYCIGIIDMLQKWDMNKKTERFIKSYLRCKPKDGISCVPPKQYGMRFLNKMQEIGIGYIDNDKKIIDINQ
eukprot:70804_1